MQPLDVCNICLQVSERAQVLGSGLLAKGCKPTPKQFVGIFAQNRPEVHHTHVHTCATCTDTMISVADYYLHYCEGVVRFVSSGDEQYVC